MTDTAKDHVDLVDAIDRWLQMIDPGNPAAAADSAVDLADLLHAAADVRALLADLMAIDPRNASKADEALQIAANIEVQLFTELRGHLESLQESWPRIMERLSSLGS